jgi:hypothetical protein
VPLCLGGQSIANGNKSLRRRRSVSETEKWKVFCNVCCHSQLIGRHLDGLTHLSLSHYEAKERVLVCWWVRGLTFKFWWLSDFKILRRWKSYFKPVYFLFNLLGHTAASIGDVMMGTEIVPETSVSTCNQLTWLCAREEFIEFSSLESFKLYTVYFLLHPYLVCSTELEIL